MRAVHIFAFVLPWALAATALNGAPWSEPKSDFGGAEPLNLDEWYTFKDYPQSAIDAADEGMVVIGFTVDINGRLTDCHVIQPSKHKTLDSVPCRVLSQRARFKPAVDSRGRPRATTGTTAMSFWMPK
jgi:TonB family protein